MRFTFAVLTALVAPIVAENTTPAPTATTSGAWYQTGPPWASNDPAKWSSVYSSLLSDGKIPSTLTAAPWPTGSYGPGQGPWGQGGFHGPGGPGRHWGGSDGPGPWGSSNYGPYSDWSTRSDWRNGPWTAWWDGSKCPPSDWPGWTAGPWSTSAPWTSWEGCTASTTATSVVTTTVSGVVTTTVSGVVATSTAYGLQVAQASKETTTTSTTKQGAGERVTVGMGAVVGAAVLGLAMGL